MKERGVFAVTFLGHQGWLIRTERACLLVDPILVDSFGHGGAIGVVYPPRVLDRAALPTAHAVLLTHEHEDHFDLASLAVLSRNTRVLVSGRVSVAARSIIREMGFSPEFVSAGTAVAIEDIEIHLLAPDHMRAANADEWDVLPYFVRDRAGHGCMFSPVDVAVTATMWRRLRGLHSRPGLVAYANNALDFGITQAGVLSADSVHSDHGFLTALIGLLADAARQWGAGAVPLLSGSGFSFVGDRTFLNECLFPISNYRVGEALAQALGPKACIAPLPGTTMTMRNGSVDEVADHSAFLAARELSSWPLRERRGATAELLSDYAPAYPMPSLGADEWARVELALKSYAEFLYGRWLFRALLSLYDSDLDGRRRAYALVLRDESDDQVFEYAVDECAFLRVDVEDAGETFVAGLELWASDWLALAEGLIPPSAVVFGRCRTWSHSSELPLHAGAALWEYFHPLRRPMVALRLYRGIVGNTNSGPWRYGQRD